MKRRIDILLVERGLAESREKAHALILAGEVLVNERVVAKPATQVKADVPIRLRQKPPFVSRGGIKLAHALEQFHIDVDSQVALDVGTATGGFTDCLLKRGASRVYAVDVGYGQLDYRLRVDPRVVVMERVNARYPFSLPEPVDLVTIDLSFISLEKVVPNVAKLVKPGGKLICLVKPQFEVGRAQVGKGGLVKDPLLHAGVLGRFISWAIKWGA
ncbi:MAG: TlyA family RNA methyltransferase, partial [Dehalococcoidia bacterium]|nr:TlyA family RNA methyltransferase [Dehalococcoidia bacterium]